jgi:hypothetical protein
MDASGNMPGSYVLTDDNAKHGLSTLGVQTFVLAKDFSIEEGQRTDMVIDLDLRKAIQYQNGGGDRYDFVTAADLQTAFRIVDKGKTGTISGMCENTVVSTDKIVVYAYHKGEYNRDVEMQAQNGIAFKNAVTSAVVGNDGSFRMAFLEAGEYELHFAAYKDNNRDGALDLQGTLLLNSLMNLESIRLNASTEVQLEILVTGILP